MRARVSAGRDACFPLVASARIDAADRAKHKPWRRRAAPHPDARIVAKPVAGRLPRRQAKAIAGLTAAAMPGAIAGVSAHPTMEPKVGSSNLSGRAEKPRFSDDSALSSAVIKILNQL
jgi:hypothetical protein